MYIEFLPESVDAIISKIQYFKTKEKVFYQLITIAQLFFKKLKKTFL